LRLYTNYTREINVFNLLNSKALIQSDPKFILAIFSVKHSFNTYFKYFQGVKIMISQVTIDIDYVAKEIEQTLVFGPEKKGPKSAG